jgi:hypothetical protein
MTDQADRLITHSIEKLGTRETEDRINVCLAVAPVGFAALSDTITALFYWASVDEWMDFHSRIERMVGDGITSLSL